MPSYTWHYPSYYILCLLSIVLPLWLIYTLVIILLMFLAGYGMYRLLYEYFKMPQWLSLIGGIFFCFISQIQSNNIIHTVFNYTFPIFFMLVIDISNDEISLKSKFLTLLSILFIFHLSYPVLTLPLYCVIHGFLLLFLNYHFKERTKKLLFNSILIWIGYIFLCLPVLYGLFDFIPLNQRTYHYISIRDISLIKFIKNCYLSFHGHSIRTITYISTCGGIIYFFFSKQIRKLYLLLFLTILLTCIGSSGLLGKTFFSKMDLGHFSWLYPVITTLIPFLIIN